MDVTRWLHANAADRASLRSAGNAGNGKIGRQAAYFPDRCLRDGMGGRNGNSRLLAAAAVPIVDQGAAAASCKERRPKWPCRGPKIAARPNANHPAQICNDFSEPVSANGI